MQAPVGALHLADDDGRAVGRARRDDGAAGVLEAAKGFRRVHGCQDMPALVAALRARDARLGLGESSEMVA